MSQDLHIRLRRTLGLIIAIFIGLIAWQSYWHLAMSDWLYAQPTNRRLARAERDTPRGAIYDHQGRRLAWTERGQRQYADPVATAAVLGYIDPTYGRTGIEGNWDLELAGLSRTFSAADLRRILTHETPRGNDLDLTLDLDLQRDATAALGDARGAVVMLDPETGGILALATAPTFNLTSIRADYPTLASDKGGALRNRATQDLYPPGSTMKLVTASAALMHGVSPDVTYTCQGKGKVAGATVTDFHGETHGTTAMPNALAHSCNFFFASTAAKLGATRYFETAQSFGFAEKWWTRAGDLRKLPLSIAKSSLAPMAADKVKSSELAHMGFGQSTVVATPLQMAMVAAAIAQDGTLMTPYLVKRLRKGESQAELVSFAPTPLSFPLNRDNARLVKSMMRRVVTSGTGRGAEVPGITVYGKTGTAEQVGGNDHAWFVGFAEKERGGKIERVAFAVVIERGGTGGRVAIPVLRRVLARWARR